MRGIELQRKEHQITLAAISCAVKMISAICSAVDALVEPVDKIGCDAMHALMCVNHHAYAVLEGGSERDVVDLSDASRNLECCLLPEASEARDGVRALSDLVVECASACDSSRVRMSLLEA